MDGEFDEQVGRVSKNNDFFKTDSFISILSS